MSHIINGKTNTKFIQFLNRALEDGAGYVYGAFGQVCTVKLLDEKARQYPDNNLAGGAMRIVGEKWLGKRVMDCGGLLKYYLMAEAYGKDPAYIVSVDAQTTYTTQIEKGTNMSAMPDLPGICVYMPGHIGFYIGNGQVIESQGTADGVVKTKLSSRGWTSWAKSKFIDYGSSTSIIVNETTNKPAAGGTSSGNKNNTPAPPAKPTNKTVNATYKVCTQKHGWLPEVTNLNDYAGWEESTVINIALKVSDGAVKYRVHITGAGWLPYVTGYDTKDSVNGYAGNNKPIDAIEIYFSTPNSIRPYKKAKYRVAPVSGNYFSWQYDNETTGGQDGYAGAFGKNIGKVQIAIE